ncbi:DNA-3-methyladenine glycosylase family protein [Geomicrobium sediminis]|uniref:DNA-3-methyladenine glycosylase family protein n=1 Tax=Geomicrobium sediminis TaxID=1347788 RepID=UPI003B82CCDA
MTLHTGGVLIYSFSFEQNLAYLMRSPLEPMYAIEGNKITRAIEVDDHTHIFQLSNHEDKLRIDTFEGNSQVVHDFVTEWLDLHYPLSSFYEMATDDPLLSNAINDYRGLRLIGIPDLFEALTWGIIGQQVNLTFAYTLKKRLVETYGHTVPFNNHSLSLFPQPTTIAELSIDDLLPLQLSRRKSEYLIHVARHIAEGSLSKTLLSSELESAEKQLTNIRGIGPWTANYVLMRCLRYARAFPIDDVGFQNAMKHVLHSQDKPSKETIMGYAKHWRGFEAYAVFYLWRTLQG